MSRAAEVYLKWPDRERLFRLGIGELRELQEKCDAGPLFILSRVSGGQWFLDDLRETIRLGLIGGGTKAAEALLIVERYIDPHPKADFVPYAQAILAAALFGVKDEKLGERGAARGGQTKTREAASSSPASTAAPSTSDGTPEQ